MLIRHLKESSTVYLNMQIWRSGLEAETGKLSLHRMDQVIEGETVAKEEGGWCCLMHGQCADTPWRSTQSSGPCGSNWTEKRREPTLGSVAMLYSSKHRHVGDRGLGPARPFYTWLHGNIKRVWNGTFSMRDALDPRLEEEKKKRKCC